MSQRLPHFSRPALLASALTTALALGCAGGSAGDFIQAAGGNPSGLPSPAGSAGQGGSSTTGGGSCEGDVVSDSKRVVRLSFNQLSRSLHALLGDAFAAKVDADFEIGTESTTARTFPPLSSPQEGGTVTTGIWQKIDLIASAAGSYAAANLNQVTNCGAAPTDGCVKTFILSLAESAYRHPLSASETASLNQVYDEVKSIYGTIPDALQHSVYAITQSPQFLYRTEIGDSKSQAGALTPYELASSIAYFLSDAPPDAELLRAAAQAKLSTAAEIDGQVTRLMASDLVRKNLESAILSYFRVDNLATVKIDDPAFTSGTAAKPYTGVRESAYHEVELFFANTLWNGPLTGLLTSKKSYLNNTLAALYGVSIPAQTDETRFVATDLPANRAGLLTQVGFLASNSRPDVPSVVARGLVVNKSMLCQTNPPFPTDPALVAKIEEAGTTLASASERERAAYRASTPPCSGCHRVFDAYGLALDSYDIIGRYRTMDPQGRPIDPSVTLPALFGDQVSPNAVDMQQRIAENPGFTACFSKNMLSWALAEGSQLTPTSCATKALVDAFDKTDKSLSSLLRQIAVSKAFTHRNAGANP